jgi:hypothetical protein
MSYTNGLDKPTDYFNIVLYTGNATARSITGVGFQPDWLWIKKRSESGNHRLVDSIRGATKELLSDATDAEATTSGQVTSFDSDGFSLGTSNSTNKNTITFVAWNWLAGGSASSNTDGSITSTVSANTTAGFSIVSYTGNATTGATIGHGLSATPKMIIVKNRTDSSSSDWVVYNENLGNTKAVYLNLTDGSGTVGAWNSTSPTSSVFTVNNANALNGSGDSLIAYCFAEKKGYSKFGSYTGNGNADGTFVYLGFKPAWIMIKKTSSSTGRGWYIWDNKRIGYNVKNYNLEANATDAEDTTERIDLLSNGFKWRSSNLIVNESGINYIFMAFAESPFVNSNGIPNNAR